MKFKWFYDTTYIHSQEPNVTFFLFNFLENMIKKNLGNQGMGERSNRFDMYAVCFILFESQEHIYLRGNR